MIRIARNFKFGYTIFVKSRLNDRSQRVICNRQSASIQSPQTGGRCFRSRSKSDSRFVRRPENCLRYQGRARSPLAPGSSPIRKLDRTKPPRDYEWKVGQRSSSFVLHDVRSARSVEHGPCGPGRPIFTFLQPLSVPHHGAYAICLLLHRPTVLLDTEWVNRTRQSIALWTWRHRAPADCRKQE
jgi:hypothetical protein